VDRDQIFVKLRDIMVSMLGLAPEEVRPESSLIEDLGAESLDLLDFTFKIEETFGVTIDPNEFSRSAAGKVADRELFEDDGRTFTATGLATLKGLLPEVPPERFPPVLDRTRLPRLLTMDVFVSLVARKLAAKAGGA
jgi:acyl carrier protein